MAGTIQYSAVDAGVLVQIADAANGNLAQTPFLPVGWDLFTTITTPGLGSPQAILAGGMLPSTGAAVAVLAFGAPASAFLPYYTPAMHTLAPPLITTLLPPPPPPPPVLPPPAIDNGFQALYLRLQSLIGTALTNFATSYPILLTCGIGGPGALAQLAAIDFRVGGSHTPSFLTAVGCYAFSTPSFVNATAAQTSVQAQLPDVYGSLFALTAQNVDFFPSAPTPAMGYMPLGRQIAVPAPLPAYDSPWYERSGAYYTSILAPNAGVRRNVGPACPAPGDDDVIAAAAGYDSDFAYVLSQFCAAANEAFQHPALSPSVPASWTLINVISDTNGQAMGVVYSRLSQVVVAFRGTSSFEETVQTFGNANAQYVNFLPEPKIQTAGTVLQGAYNGYLAIRQGFRQVLSQISNISNMSLVLTGHDTGGWLAVMAATDLMQGTGGTPSLPTLPAPQVYTFGAPPLGSIPFGGFITSNVTSALYNVVRRADIVPNIFYPGNFPVGSQVVVAGTTNYDGLTYHPVISYIQLLNPHNLADAKSTRGR
jgi:Lipase (class 3)